MAIWLGALTPLFRQAQGLSYLKMYDAICTTASQITERRYLNSKKNLIEINNLGIIGVKF